MVRIIRLKGPGAPVKPLKCEVCGEECGSSNTQALIETRGNAKMFEVICFKCSDILAMLTKPGGLTALVKALRSEEDDAPKTKKSKKKKTKKKTKKKEKKEKKE